MRIAVLGSTRGTHLTTLVDAIREETLAAEIALVISNKADALILEKASSYGIKSLHFDHKNLTRENFDKQISSVLKEHLIDFIVLIGYMRILSAAFVDEWQAKIINIHPSLLPKFAGLKDLAVHQAVLDAKESFSGSTVHFVVAEVDKGPIILQRSCPVFLSDTAESLKARVQALEGKLLIDALKNLNRGDIL